MKRNGIDNAEKNLLLFYCYLRNCFSEGHYPPPEKVTKWCTLCKKIVAILEEMGDEHERRL